MGEQKLAAIARHLRPCRASGGSDGGLFTLPYSGTCPQFASAPIASSRAAVLGRATIGRNAHLGASSVIRADGHFVQIGDDFSLGSRSTVHIAHDVYPAIIGDRVTVGENAVVHACTVGSDVVIGDGAVILDGSVVGDSVVIEPHAIVFPRSELAGGKLYAGMPARPVRDLEPGEVEERAAEMRRRSSGAEMQRVALAEAISAPASSSPRPRDSAAASSRRKIPASGSAATSTRMAARSRSAKTPISRTTRRSAAGPAAASRSAKTPPSATT